jgi:AGZA family xanthine/uracil permease-like MFS transporter
MLDRLFRLSEHQTTVRIELLAGLTTFLTMAYIIFLQPAILTGQLFRASQGKDFSTGMDFGAIMTATCLAAALATAIMGLYGRYPIAQAPGMGENFFFVFSAIPAAAAMIHQRVAAGLLAPGATTPWQVALGVVFWSGVLFLLVSIFGVREAILNAVSSSMRDGIAVGIGLFITFIGLQATGLVVRDPHVLVTLNHRFASPDLVVFFFGLLLTAALSARRVRGAILWGIGGSTLLAVGLRLALPRLGAAVAKSGLVTGSMLMTQFALADKVIAPPPSLAPTLLKMDLLGALCWPMIPFILIFLFMVLFDTLGTLIGVCQQAGLIRDNRLERARQALVSDAVGTVAGAALGTSTVTSFVESAAGVEHGGRTGLTALCVAALFLLALLFSPLIAMVGSYPPITAPALVIVGSMMMRNVTKVAWDNYAEALPAFLIMIGIPLSYSIADGLAVGFIAYPIVKLSAGQGRDVRWLMYLMAAVLLAYFLLVRVAVK